jgi:hypothetical protein
MENVATCAKCGIRAELCGSVRVRGIQQPKFCEGCLMDIMITGDESFNDKYWAMQIGELNDTETIEHVIKELIKPKPHS